MEIRNLKEQTALDLSRATATTAYWLSLLLHESKRFIQTLLLLLQIRMNVQIQCSPDVRMTQQHANCLVVTIALDTSGRKTMPQSVELDFRYPELAHQRFVIVAVSPWLNRLILIA